MLQSRAPTIVIRVAGKCVEIGQPDELDAEGMKGLFVARAIDSAPTHPERGEWRAQWCDKDNQGYTKFLRIIRNAQESPQTYFARVAKIGSTIIGMAYGHALPDSHITLCHHIAVIQDLEGLGIATALLDSLEYGWARQIGRPILSHIDPGNLRSQRLFGRHGYQRLGRLTILRSSEPNGSQIGLPMTYDVQALLLDSATRNKPTLVDLLYDVDGLQCVADEFRAYRSDQNVRVEEDVTALLLESLGVSIDAVPAGELHHDYLGREICNHTTSPRLLGRPSA